MLAKRVKLAYDLEGPSEGYDWEIRCLFPETVRAVLLEIRAVSKFGWREEALTATARVRASLPYRRRSSWADNVSPKTSVTDMHFGGLLLRDTDRPPSPRFITNRRLNQI